MSGIRENLVRILSVGCILAAIVWFALGRLGGAGLPPSPPLPDGLDNLDPSVVALIRRQADAVADNRGSAARWVELGLVYEANGLFRYAVATYEQAIALDETDARPWYRLAASHERVGDLDRAIEAMQQAAMRDDSIADVQSQLGAWLLDSGRLEEADTHLRRAVTLAPSDQRASFGLVRLALARRDAAGAITGLEERGLLGGPNAAYAYRLLGQAHRHRGEEEAADAALARGGPGTPSFPTVRFEELLPYRTGVVAARQDVQRLLQQGKRAEARRILENMRQLDARDTGVLVMLARLDLQERQFDRAVAQLEAALEINANEFDANLTLAHVLQTRNRRGDLDRALAHIERAITSRPLDSQARRVKGRVLARAGRGAEAVEMLKEAYRKDGRDIGLLALAGAIEGQLGRWTDAAGTFDDVLAVRPDDSHSLLGLARAYAELGDRVRAGAALDRIAPNAPVDPRAVAELRRRIEGG